MISNTLDTHPEDTLVRVTRPDGCSTLLRVPGEHWERVVALAAGEFADKSIAEVQPSS